MIIGFFGVDKVHSASGSRHNPLSVFPAVNKKRASGHTLVEILIALIIIGIITAIVLPAIFKTHQDRVLSAKKQKAYNVLSNVGNLMIVREGSPKSWGFNNGETFLRFSKYLNFIKICNTAPGCWKATEIKNLHGKNHNLDADTNYYKAVFMDGMSIAFKSLDHGKQEYRIGKHSVYGEFFVDLNGKKGPNQADKDVIGFWITDSGFILMKQDELVQDRLIERTNNTP